ncbi:MAG: hypothetical protein U9P73_04370 [Candidatus Cloacimonadota bacterium]|nr:hypothetical protein [Candidatus Cloacimonadota bacterium]
MKKKNYFEIVVFFFYSIISYSWIWLHEPWRDEAQAWLIVRDLNFGEILKQLVWEGTPGLWHLLLNPLAKLGLPYYSEFILHWSIVVVAIALLLFRSPFNKWIKISIIFSYYFFYEYVIIARNYSLTMLLLFALASLYNKRFKLPILYSLLILFLFNTNVHSFLAAGALLIIYIWEVLEKKKYSRNYLFAILIMLFGGLLVIFQIHPGNSNNALVQFSLLNFNFSSVFIAIGNAFLPAFGVNIYKGFFFSMFLIFLLFRFIERPKIFIFFLVSITWLFFIFGAIYQGKLRQHGLIIIFLIFSLWLENYYQSENIKFDGLKKTIYKRIKQIGYIILIISLSLSVFISVKSYSNEYRFYFSGSKHAAEFIKNNISYDQVIIAHRSYACSSLLPYLPNHKFWYADREEFGSFLIWDTKFKQDAYTLSNELVLERAEKKFGKTTNKIFLLTTPISGSMLKNFEKIYYTQKKVFRKKDEQFQIYQEKHEQ